MDLLARDRLERAARLNFGRNIDEPLPRAFLQPLANEFRRRFLASGEHENGSVRGLPQMPGGGCARTLGAACELIDDLLRRVPIGERDLVERQSQVGPGEGKGVKAGFGTGPSRRRHCRPSQAASR